MSLQVWLPLNGDLRNKGVANIDITNNGATVNNNGKIGKCYSFGTAASRINIDSTPIKSFTEMSLTFWIKIISWNTNYATLFQAGIGTAPWASYIFGVLRNGNTSNLCFTISNGSTASNNSYTTSDLELNTWYHLGFTYSNNHCKIYINGILYKNYTTTINPSFSSCTHCTLGAVNNGSYQSNCLMNDVRIYNHALSAAEVKEISRGLVLHYKFDDLYNSENKNLFRDTYMANLTVYEASTDWTKYFRWYNGSASKHTIINGEDTILLNVAHNMGIAFQRKATDIELDSNSYYTVSCEAKTTRVNGKLCMGTSYYNTSNAWVWRGGSSPREFNATNTWQKFYWTFKPDADTQYIMYCFTMLGTTGGTDTFSIKNCKLEKGSIATKWNFNPEDKEYNILGYNSNSIIDNSGNGYNGTITGTLNISSDSPRYSKCQEFDGASFISATPLCSEVKTLSVWVKTTKNKTTNQMICIDSASLMAIGFWQGNIIGVVGSGAGTGSKCTLGSSYKENDWNHIVVVDTGSKTRDIYCNGVKLTPTSNDYWSTYNTGFFVGSRNNSSPLPFFGYISDLKAYATALSKADILDLYQMGAKIDSKNKFHTYELVEDSSTIKINKKGQLQINELNETTGINFDSTKDLNANELIEI